MSRWETHHRLAHAPLARLWRKGAFLTVLSRFFREKYRFGHVSEIPVTGSLLILVLSPKTGTTHSLALKILRTGTAG